jgi:hypothetical protein
MHLNTATYLSLIMAISGCLGLIFAGKGKWYGWAINLASQPVWIIFGIITHGYFLCVAAVMYGAVFIRNIRLSLTQPG